MSSRFRSMSRCFRTLWRSIDYALCFYALIYAFLWRLPDVHTLLVAPSPLTFTQLLKYVSIALACIRTGYLRDPMHAAIGTCGRVATLIHPATFASVVSV